jgi:hypothetical protein
MARTRKYYLQKQLFDLEVKGQGPTKMHNSLNKKEIVNWEKNIKVLSFFGKNLYKIISLLKLNKNNYLTLRSKVKVQRRSLRYATHHFMVMHPHTKYH